jgi:PAS domain S-box-containing protein
VSNPPDPATAGATAGDSAAADPLAFLSGGGEAARMIRERDWSGHPLGPPAGWPEGFRIALSLVLNSPESMILAWGPDLHFFFNDTYFPLLGPRLAWAMGARFDEVWSDGWEQAKPIIDEAMAGRAKRFIDLPWTLGEDRGARQTWWTFSYSRVLDAEGRIAGLFIFTNETTDRVLAERKASVELERLVTMYEQAPSFMAMLRGPEHRFELVNPAYQRLIGHRDAMGRTVAEVLPDAVEQGYLTLLDEVYRTGEAYTARGARYAVQAGPDGQIDERYVDFVFQPVTRSDGSVDGIFVEGNDVTDAYLSAQALRESEGRYRTLFESMDEGFCVIEFFDGPHGPLSDYVHVEANPAYARNAGIENVVGQKVREMVPDEAGGWVELYGGVLRTGEPIRFERELVATGRHLELAAFRIEPPSRRQVAVLFKDVTESARTRERYRLAIEATSVGIFDYNLVTGELGWDARVRELFGVGPADPVTYEAAFLAGLHPEDRTRADRAVQAALDPAGTGLFDMEYRVRPLDGAEERWLAARGQAVVSEGRTVRFVGTVRDVTAAKEAEEALRAAEGRYRLATRATNDAIWDWDLLANHVLWNEALTTAYGHQPADVEPTGDWWIAQIHPEDRARIDASIHAVIDGTGTSWSDEYRFRRADGSYAFVLDRGYVTRGDGGRPERMVGAMFDLTERMSAEAALRRLAETLEERVADRTRERNRIWETTNDLMGTAGFDGYMKSVNPAWTRGLGWSEKEILSRPFVELIDPADHAETADVVARLASGQPVSGFVDRVKTREGGQRVIMWTAVPDPGTELFHIVGRDLTEQRQAEEALLQSQKMEAVGQLTGGIAHDFNNLLAGISGSLELMQTRIRQGRIADIERYLVVAQGASKRAASLTHRLLAFSRRQTLDPKPTNVNLLVAGMEDLIRRTVGPAITLEVVGASGLWPTLVDPSQLENALLNLCINARDAMPDGGRITIETANKWLDRSAALRHEVPEGQYLSLCVTDTGPGMTPEVIARAFEPFFTTKPIGQGTGLGLSMIYGFAKQSGGQVRIYSELGQGTTVCIYLPRYFGEAVVPDALIVSSEPAVSPEGETVLVVDDEPAVRMLVTEVLEDLGYTAIEAADSAAGLRILQSDVRIDLLVTDVGLPGGMNGRQMADAGREVRPGLKVLFITGYAENAAIGNGHLEPGMQLLTKPFAVETLAIRIRELVRGD